MLPPRASCRTSMIARFEDVVTWLNYCLEMAPWFAMSEAHETRTMLSFAERGLHKTSDSRAHILIGPIPLVPSYHAHSRQIGGLDTAAQHHQVLLDLDFHQCISQTARV